MTEPWGTDALDKAEVIGNHCHKGSRLAITGTFRNTTDWSGKKHNRWIMRKHDRWEIILTSVTFCDKKQKIKN